MRFCFVLGGILGGLAILGLGLPAYAGQPQGGPYSQGAQLTPVPMSEGTQAAEAAGEAECEESGVGGRVCRPGVYGRLLNKWAGYGAFNCGCSGSYKYPVPPQYTYHWPGMYSQRTMTEYVSPYRFPPLKPPPKGEDLLEPEEEKEGNVSGRITIRPIRPVTAYQPLGR